MTTDIVYLLHLGLSIEQVADRAKVSAHTVRRELQAHAERQERVQG